MNKNNKNAPSMNPSTKIKIIMDCDTLNIGSDSQVSKLIDFLLDSRIELVNEIEKQMNKKTEHPYHNERFHNLNILINDEYYIKQMLANLFSDGKSRLAKEVKYEDIKKEFLNIFLTLI